MCQCEWDWTELRIVEQISGCFGFDTNKQSICDEREEREVYSQLHRISLHII